MIDLQKELKSNFREVSFRELNRDLMKNRAGRGSAGLWLMKGKKQVELIAKPMID